MSLTLQARPLPLLKRDGPALLRALDLSIRAGAVNPGRRCHAQCDDGLQIRNPDLGELAEGENSLRLLVKEVESARSCTLRVSYGDLSAHCALDLSPARQWTVYLALHSHTDLGFTAPVSEVARIHNRNTDRAVELCLASAIFPEGERFKWTCEVTWQIQNYLRERSPEQVHALMNLVRLGAIEIGGLYAGEHTDLLGDEQAVRSLSYAGYLRRAYDVPVNTVLLSDVPGCTSGFVQIMAKSGMRNFLLADNNFIAPFLPRTDLPRPFTWLGADDTSILCWYTDHPYYAYLEGELYGFTRGTDDVSAALPQKLATLEAADYPFSSLLIQYAFDNAELDPRPAEIARQCNRIWTTPQIRIATPAEFFDALRREGGTSIPQRRGDWTSWWASIADGFPVESALTRNLHDRLPAVETLATIISLHNPSATDRSRTVAQCYDGILAFDEHSGGGGVWKPRSEQELTQSLREGYGFLYDARAAIDRLEEETDNTLGHMLKSHGPAEAVINLLPWKRSGPVRMRTNDQETFVYDVPAYGFALLDPTNPSLQAGEKGRPARIRKEGEGGRRGQGGEICILETDCYRIRLDTRSGIILSVRDLRQGHEIIRNGELQWGVPVLYEAIPSRPIELGKFLPEIYDGTPAQGKTHSLLDGSTISCNASSLGLGGAECIVRRSFEGVEWSRTRISLTPYDDALFMETTICRAVIDDPRVQKVLLERSGAEPHIYLPLGFNLPGCQIHYESPGNVLNPPDEQFKGTCMDFYAVQHWLLLSGEKSCVALAGPDTPLIDIGSPGVLRFRSELDPDRSFLYVRLADLHEWGTRRESPFSSGEDLRFRFALSSFPRSGDRENDILKARRLGWEIQNPLRTIILQPDSSTGTGIPEGSFIQLEPEHVQLMTLKKPCRGTGIVVRVQEKLGMPADMCLSMPGFPITAARRLTLTEEVIGEIVPVDGEVHVRVNAHGIETFHLTLEKEPQP
jgi:alpha-mannosidase